MKYISAQPATQYYGWQVETYLNNFQIMGVPMDDVIVVLAGDHPYFNKIKRMYPMVEFFHAEDSRSDKSYAPSIQGHIMYKYWKHNPSIEKCHIFFNDCDIVFTKPFDFQPVGNHMSDTSSYMGVKYIDSKGTGILDKMASLVGIDSDIIRRNDGNVGGAHKILKNIGADYWKDVEESSVRLFNGMLNTGTDLQIWTASMWAELWELWKRGESVIVDKSLDFCWATCGIYKWSEVGIMHNAGVVTNNAGMFMKSDYIDRLPYDDILPLDKNRCSYGYYSWVKMAGLKNRNFV